MTRDWTGWMCHVPARMDADESAAYRELHRIFCARKDEPDHACSGRVTIDRNGVTVQCPLCGDARRVYGD